MKKPDHNTINCFRSEKLSDVLKQISSQIISLLQQKGIVSLKEAVLLTVLRASQRRTFVRGKSIKANKEKMKPNCMNYWGYAQSIASEELKETSLLEYSEINPENVKETVAKIIYALENK